MTNTNTQIDAYREQRPPKAHELQLLEIISERHPDFHGAVLDIGCAAGSFIGLMIDSFPNATYTGFDISEDLIQLAKEKYQGNNVEFVAADALGFCPSKKYDIIIASGVLSIFDDFVPPLEKWLSWLSQEGRIYIFGRFNSKNIDTIIKFRNNYKRNEIWEGGLTAYSVHTIMQYLNESGLKGEFIRFVLPIEMSEAEDPIRTFTKITTDGEKLVLNGANIIAEHFHLIVQKNGG